MDETVAILVVVGTLLTTLVTSIVAIYKLSSEKEKLQAEKYKLRAEVRKTEAETTEILSEAYGHIVDDLQEQWRRTRDENVRLQTQVVDLQELAREREERAHDYRREARGKVLAVELTLHQTSQRLSVLERRERRREENAKKKK